MISFLVIPTSTRLIRVEESVVMQLVNSNADKLNPNSLFSVFLMIVVFFLRGNCECKVTQKATNEVVKKGHLLSNHVKKISTYN